MTNAWPRIGRLALGLLSSAILGASAGAQTVPPYPGETHSQAYPVRLSGGNQVSRYALTDGRDLNSLPASLLTYLNQYRPLEWSFGTDFDSVPNFMSGLLYTDNYFGRGAGEATFPLIDPRNGTEPIIPFGFQARWWPFRGVTLPGLPGLTTRPDGKSLWIVVVRQDNNGAYQILPSTATPNFPSYYNLQSPGGQDDQSSNGYYPPNYNPSNWPVGNTTYDFTKLINIRENFGAWMPVGGAIKYYVMMCNWSTDNVHTSVTIRDALLLRFGLGSSWTSTLPPYVP